MLSNMNEEVRKKALYVGLTGRTEEVPRAMYEIPSHGAPSDHYQTAITNSLKKKKLGEISN